MRNLLLALLVSIAVISFAAENTLPLDCVVYTDKDDVHEKPQPHPLTYWTEDPLRLDLSNDLLIGFKGPDGHTITSADFDVQKQIKGLGAVAGHRVMQLDLTIIGKDWHGGSWTSWWKSLLVEISPGQYIEIYALRNDFGVDENVQKQWSSGISGKGDDAVLWTNDPVGGNGGFCWEGYWWLDKSGPHPLDFGPLKKAITQSIPKGTTYTPGCWALDIPKGSLTSWVQNASAQCHLSGLGWVHATFRIRHGVVIPTSVQYPCTKQFPLAKNYCR